MNINNWESCKTIKINKKACIFHLSIITLMYFCSFGCFLIKVHKSFLMIWCHYVAVLPPANHRIADRGIEYRYIAPFKPSDNSIQPYNHQPQVRSKKRINQILISAMMSSWMCHLISDVISDVRRMDPSSVGVYLWIMQIHNHGPPPQ